MKWVVFVLAVPVAIACGGLLRSAKAGSSVAWILLGLSPFLLSAIPFADIGLLVADWRGHTHGATISLSDLIAIALFISLFGTKGKVYFVVPALFFLIPLIMSIFQTDVPMSSFYFLWKILKTYFIAYVVSIGGRDQAVIRWILIGAGLGVVMESFVAFYQHFGLHIRQAPGTFGHQNSLGLAMHFAVIPLFAAFLSGRMGWFGAAVAAAGGIIAISTASRATIGMYAAGLILMFMFSFFWSRTNRKMIVGVLGLVFGIVVSALAYQSLQTRFSEAPLSTDYDERVALANAAKAMVRDRPFGVGANNFVVVMNIGGYGERAEVSWSTGSKAIVHNIYLVVAAELGILGLLAWLVLILSPPVRVLAYMFSGRAGKDAELLAGLSLALVIVYLHSLYEWILFSDEPLYLMAMTFGMISAIVAGERDGAGDRDGNGTAGEDAPSGAVRGDGVVVGIIEQSERQGTVNARR